MNYVIETLRRELKIRLDIITGIKSIEHLPETLEPFEATAKELRDAIDLLETKAVWIIEEHDAFGMSIHGIYTTERKANEFVAGFSRPSDLKIIHKKLE